jgi:toxin ParE1/3/4
MAKISWIVEAEAWLADIFAFIAQENPKAARNVVRSIYDKVQILQDFPEIGY